MKSKNLLIISIIFIVIFLIFALYYFNNNSNYITDYGRGCKQENIAAEDCKSWSLFATTYILDKTNKSVTWYNGSGDSGRTNCHIADANNWWCDAYEGTALEGNGQNVIGFAGGKSIESTPVTTQYATEHFGFLKYWLLKIF